MPAVTSTIVALGGLGLSAAQAIKANKDMGVAQKASLKASQDLKNIKEQNQFKAVQVPTLGFDLAQQASAQRDAQALSAIQGSGAEAVIGGVGQLAQVNSAENLKLAADAQDAQYQRDLQQANAGQNIEARRQEREFNIGMGAKLDAEAQRTEAANNKTAAINSMFSTAGTALSEGSKLVDLYKNTGVEGLNTLTSNQEGWKGFPYPLPEDESANNNNAWKGYPYKYKKPFNESNLLTPITNIINTQYGG
jgi:hypothetical protein